MIRFGNVTIDTKALTITNAEKSRQWHLRRRSGSGESVSFRVMQHLLMGGGKTSAELFDMIYGNDREGGPLYGPEIIRVTMCRLQPDIDALGMRLRVSRDSGNTRYWLVANA